ncbi:pentatricopeptide repeat-containing protein-like protein [Corchorus olitorius]|uniref:Pentatricopeptide repeat-containing protein-like protein n=1 Tax=Corchorus olitorius TaxID=93759 RepID=A0A1R3K6X1_9ROSI|nr:pentatricopeptide repeat-containing protein-like protein [Corchorus olitorius]
MGMISIRAFSRKEEADAMMSQRAHEASVSCGLGLHGNHDAVASSDLRSYDRKNQRKSWSLSLTELT